MLFDGVCNFCNSSVNFIMERDKNKVFKFASLQSDFAAEILQRNGMSSVTFDTLILAESGGTIYTRSSAALRIARRLRFPWYLSYAFIVIPPFIRNYIYNFIARNRYRWFGKRDACRIPTAEERESFVE
ncbi:MAG: thiol-disulfide oxidoreductase DCC family protein [Ignavibacteria bacterium]